MMKKEYKVGEKFKVNGQTYVVKESGTCEGCVLNERGCMSEAGMAFGSCSSIIRTDRKSVKFVKCAEQPLKVVERKLLPITRCVEFLLENGEILRLGQCQYSVCIHPELTCDKCEFNFSMFKTCLSLR